MAKFRKGGKKEMQAISTASLPDIVFMLLFFFMVTTVMREVTLKVSIAPPTVSEVNKIEKKSLVSYIFVGTPKEQFQKMYGTEARIQLNDQFANIKEIREFVTKERAEMSENDQKQMIVSMKIDGDAKMGIISDVKQELKKASAFKINYSSRKLESDGKGY
ncbi:biopolymer transporter ExbD [Bacteroidales bacterium]|nr:biopolymer transporter ExbD [Bacteroidales bacterium]